MMTICPAEDRSYAERGFGSYKAAVVDTLGRVSISGSTAEALLSGSN